MMQAEPRGLEDARGCHSVSPLVSRAASGSAYSVVMSNNAFIASELTTGLSPGSACAGVLRRQHEEVRIHPGRGFPTPSPAHTFSCMSVRKQGVGSLEKQAAVTDAHSLELGVGQFPLGHPLSPHFPECTVFVSKAAE